ncbi:uncharacterized protein BCR38DRAFT_456638 [Pseudomassariella vexata]|uniref:Rhodopsin domain-containing protein n=1 Tax=Pseudomassariella vexata TaxID=1141098 RepID=A0A1Y2E347_9PEZI|nr:uncharacterized protein BCR38DRAFT_456638 [Pseudomassariella vexata]ORY65963.1 hypothetical protein BCR38DRAFT_456638 [Pseudomassariella vexata]
MADSNISGEAVPLTNRPSTILGLTISFLLFSWICVAGRLYTRVKIIRSPGWDDLFVVLYLFTTTAGTIAICLSVDHGLGQHVATLDPSTVMNYLKCFYVMNAAYVSSTTFIKLALMFQYLRIYDQATMMYRTCQAVTIFTALWGFAYSFIAWVPCFPIWQFWTGDPGAQCYGYGSIIPTQFVATYETHSAINMALDIMVLIIPLPLFFQKGTKFTQHLRLFGLIFMGTVVICIAIWRLATIIKHQAATWPIWDPTWYAPISIILAMLEIDTAAVCASVPIFWPSLSNQVSKIFVTQEIKITRETRYAHADEESQLTQSQHSRMGSEADLKRQESTRKMDAHYHDSYILRQVDPLRSPGESPRVEVEVEAIGFNSMKTRKW